MAYYCSVVSHCLDVLIVDIPWFHDAHQCLHENSLLPQPFCFSGVRIFMYNKSSWVIKVSWISWTMKVYPQNIYPSKIFTSTVCVYVHMCIVLIQSLCSSYSWSILFALQHFRSYCMHVHVVLKRFFAVHQTNSALDHYLVQSTSSNQCQSLPRSNCQQKCTVDGEIFMLKIFYVKKLCV